MEEAKVSKILDDLRQNPPPQHIEILKRFASSSDGMSQLTKVCSNIWVGMVPKLQIAFAKKSSSKAKLLKLNLMNLHL